MKTAAKQIKQTVTTEKELKKIQKANKECLIFVPAGPGGKVYYPVTITIFK
jgi:hypothetical protein